jgi:beta-lactamase class C
MMKYLLSIHIIFLFLFASCRNGTKHNSESTRPASAIHFIQKPVYSFVSVFDKFVRETMESTHLPGAAVAIVKDSDVILLKGYGVKTFGTNDSVNIHTVFRIGSISKGFASMLSGILVQENLINLDDKVNKYLPYFKLMNDSSTHQLTIRHILSHTSGLPVHSFTNLIEQGISYSTLRDNLRTIELAAPVGKEFAYQNVAFSLISDIAKEVTNKPYGTLIHEKIFYPLGMKDASVSYEDLNSSGNLAQPHFRRDSLSYNPVKNKPEYYSVLPAAGVNASISDMSKWLMALLGERPDVINKKYLKEIYKPEIETPRMRHYEFFYWPRLKKAYYALGWRVLIYNGDTLIYHGGYVNGYRSEIAFSPSDRTGIVILTNARGKLANDAVRVFFDAYQDDKVRKR